MDLKYMQQLKDNPNPVGEMWSKSIPMSQEEIEILTETSGVLEFPLSFVEYLSLAGKSNGLDVVVVAEDFEDIREECLEDLEYTGFTVERPFFVFDKLDGIYSIFFLDEEKEDPDVYILFPSGARSSGEELLKNAEYTFSKMINSSIYRAINNIPL